MSERGWGEPTRDRRVSLIAEAIAGAIAGGRVCCEKHVTEALVGAGCEPEDVRAALFKLYAARQICNCRDGACAGH
jgi:hypothetical protein